MRFEPRNVASKVSTSKNVKIVNSLKQITFPCFPDPQKFLLFYFADRNNYKTAEKDR